MPRTIPSALAAILASETPSLATLIRLERADGTVLGFTSHDAPIVSGGLTYEPSDQTEASALRTTMGEGVDNMEVAGVLSSARIREEDVYAGLYDGCRVDVRLVSPDDPGAGHVELLAGVAGDILLADGAFRVEVRGLSHRLGQTVGDVSSRLCRCARLGDGQCRVNLAGTTAGGVAIRATRALASVGADGGQLTFAGDAAPSGHYAWGSVRFTSGANAGVRRDVKQHTASGGAAVLTLRGRFPFPPAPGDVAVLEAGCDRTLTTCNAKFGNGANYHGEWHLPGNDQMMKTGRGG